MVAPRTLRRQLEHLNGFKQELERLGELDRETYVEHEAFAGRYLVQAAAQCCIDIANHVIASEGWETPTEYRETFEILERHGVLEAELAGRMKDLAGLRNRLVHIYDDVDDTLVHGFLQAGLDDLDAYATAIARLID